MENRTNKIFISYSSDDRELRQIFETRFRPYLQATRNKFDDVWTDKQIPVGSSWNNQIQQALAESNIGILLVSPMFLGSQYSMGDELQKMLARQQHGYLIVPIILRECNFTNIPQLSSIQFFKTYQSEYDVTDLNRANLMMPFDELVEVPNPNRKLLNRYFLKLANTIDDAIDKLNAQGAVNPAPPEQIAPKHDQNMTNIRNTAHVEGKGNVVLQGVNAGDIHLTINNYNEMPTEQRNGVKEQVLNLLKNNQIKEVFQHLNRLKFKEDNQNMLIMIQAQWNELERDKMIGILSHTEQTQQTNIIRSKLVQFIQNID